MTTQSSSNTLSTNLKAIHAAFAQGAQRDAQLKAGLSAAVASRSEATLMRLISDTAGQLWGQASEKAARVIAGAKALLADPRTKKMLGTAGGVAKSVAIDLIIKAIVAGISAL